MSRIGDNILQARLKQGITPKQLARKAGISESMLLDIEGGRRISSDKVTAQLYKALGIRQEVSLDNDMAQVIPAPEKPKPKPAASKAAARPAVVGAPASAAWSGAIANLIAGIPVEHMDGSAAGNHSMILQDGKIYGYSPAKVLWVICADISMLGYGIHKGSSCLILPERDAVSAGLMLIERDGQRAIRHVSRSGNVLQVTSFERRKSTETLSVSDVKILGRVKIIESVVY